MSVQYLATVHQRLMKVKDRPSREEVQGVVYTIPCECGKCYIGETGLKTRLTEHKEQCGTKTLIIGSLSTL